MCQEYDIERKCEMENSCKLILVLKENKELKKR